jgi:hypothetical protein
MSTSFLESIRDACLGANSFTRLDTLLSMFPRFKKNRWPGPFSEQEEKQLSDWFTALGENWTGCDTIAQHKGALRLLFVFHKPMWRLMMDEGENKFFASLPDKVTIYRGCGPENRDGLSWTLDRDVARIFPTLNRYHQKMPLLITTTVSKKQIVAVKLDREESEVIALVDPQDIVSEEPITEVLT